MGDDYRVKVPNAPTQNEALAKGKGVHRKVESEGSRSQNLGLTNRNFIKGLRLPDEFAQQNEILICTG
jgi:hypothetical protein